MADPAPVAQTFFMDQSIQAQAKAPPRAAPARPRAARGFMRGFVHAARGRRVSLTRPHAGVVCRQVDAILTVVDAKHIVQHLDEVRSPYPCRCRSPRQARHPVPRRLDVIIESPRK
jgi:hypothetical protein